MTNLRKINQIQIVNYFYQGLMPICSEKKGCGAVVGGGVAVFIFKDGWVTKFTHMWTQELGTSLAELSILIIKWFMIDVEN